MKVTYIQYELLISYINDDIMPEIIIFTSFEKALERALNIIKAELPIIDKLSIVETKNGYPFNVFSFDYYSYMNSKENN